MSKKIVSLILLSLIFTLAVFLRVFFCYNIVFSEPIKYTADDAIYYMRLVENTLLGSHFPSQITFDPYVHFPSGHFTGAPLFTQILAGAVWLISLGKPTLGSINGIAPFIPPLLGSLMVFVIYFTAKALWRNRIIALLSAFFMALSAPYLFKSLLGVTDHHVVEVLFSSLAMMFLIFAVKTRKNEKTAGTPPKLSIRVIREIKEEKKSWLCVLLSGVSLGLYFLVWPGALLFLFIIFIFIISDYFIQYFQGEYRWWLLAAGIIIFIISFLMILPFIDYSDLLHSPIYNVKHIIAFIGGILIFLALLLFSYAAQKRGTKSKITPILILLLVGILAILAFKIIFPLFWQQIIQTFRAVNGSYSPIKEARQLVSEMIPMGFNGFVGIFSSLFFVSLLALAFVIREFAKKKKPEDLLIVIWTIILMLVSGILPFLGQQRFGMYLSFNISFLASFLLIKGFSFGWRGLQLIKQGQMPKSAYSYTVAGSVIIIFNVIFLFFYPFPFNAAYTFPMNLPDILRAAVTTAQQPFVAENDVYTSLLWMRDHTPEPGIDYYAFYENPKINKKTGEINPYPYPSSAYGVLARWDVGYLITYYAHRMTNATPGHEGIGQIENNGPIDPGEAVFFLEDSEEKAARYLDIMKTRYIITDHLSVDPSGIFFSKVQSLGVEKSGYLENKESENKPSKYDNSMIVRLHLLDGKAVQTSRKVNNRTLHFYIEPLSRFRLIYESPTKIPLLSLASYNEIKAIKIFEYVKGARIIGRTDSKDKIVISAEVATNQERIFTYEKSMVPNNGYFEFMVPYSTIKPGKWLPNQTQSAVFAKPYKLKIGGKEVSINVSEEDISKGNTIEIK